MKLFPLLCALSLVMTVATLGAEGAAAAKKVIIEASIDDVVPYVSISLPDLATSRERLKTTPYQGLIESEWGSFLVNEMITALNEAEPMIWPNVTLAKSAAANIGFALPKNLDQDSDFSPEPQVAGAAWLTSPQATALAIAMVAHDEESYVLELDKDNFWSRSDGDGSIHVDNDDTLYVTNALGSQLTRPETDSEADLHAAIDYSGFIELMEADLDQEFLDALSEINLTIDITLAEHGLVERVDGTYPNMEVENQPFPAADREQLASLPTDTLWAVTFPSDAEWTKAWLAQEIGLTKAFEATPWLEINKELEAKELPNVMELFNALDGHHLVYAQRTAPIPSITVALAMNEDVARPCMAAVAAELNLEQQENGWRGMVGMVSISMAYHDGRWVATNHPMGIQAFTTRQPGFLENATIQQALKHIPNEDLTVLGLSRSGEWWGHLASIGSLLLAQTEVPGLMNLGQDLRATNSYGYLWSTMTENNTAFVLESSGLLGGVMSQSMLTPSMIGAYFFVQFEMGMGRMDGLQIEAVEPPQ